MHACSTCFPPDVSAHLACSARRSVFVHENFPALLLRLLVEVERSHASDVFVQAEGQKKWFNKNLGTQIVLKFPRGGDAAGDFSTASTYIREALRFLESRLHALFCIYSISPFSSSYAYIYIYAYMTMLHAHRTTYYYCYCSVGIFPPIIHIHVCARSTINTDRRGATTTTTIVISWRHLVAQASGRLKASGVPPT